MHALNARMRAPLRATRLRKLYFVDVTLVGHSMLCGLCQRAPARAISMAI
jgi:hypothetical protein